MAVTKPNQTFSPSWSYSYMIQLIKIMAFVLMASSVPGISAQGASTSHLSDPELWFHAPDIFVWSNVIGQYNPYDLLTTDHLGEYLIGDTRIHSKTEIYLIMYDNATVIDTEDEGMTATELTKALQKQNLAKEYFWRFYNDSGVLPSVTWFNTTVQSTNQFTTRSSDSISYHLRLTPDNFHRTNLTVPAFDLKIEMPANSGTVRTKKTFLDLPSWGLTRWRLSNASLVVWSDIASQKSLEVVDPGSGSGGTGTAGAGKLVPKPKLVTPRPELFRRIHAPCVTDFFAFYILTSESDKGPDHLYLHMPLMKDDHWIDVTPSFCNASSPECSFEKHTPILLTNDHLLALTTNGLFASDILSSSEGKLSDAYLKKPLLPFKRFNPCAELEDVVICFGDPDPSAPSPNPVTATSIRMSYNPVCHLHQHPNFRDTVILVIEHPGTGSGTGVKGKGKAAPPSAFSVVYADAPYTDWHILFKAVSQFRNENQTIIAIPAIFYNHQLNQFDIVITISVTNIDDTGKLTTTIRSVRHLLHRPKFGAFFYTELASSPQKGFQGFEFKPKFKLTGVQVTPGSMDIFFYGNQLYIAETGGFLVYLALGAVYGESDIESCSFGHPDRFYLCTNKGNTVLLVGRVGNAYAPAEIYPHQIPAISNLLTRRGVILPLDDPSWTPEKNAAVQTINNARMIEFFRNAHFTISHGGNIMMWYLKSFKISPDTIKDPFTLRFYEVSSSVSVTDAMLKAEKPDFDAAIAAAMAKKKAGSATSASQDKDNIVRLELNLDKLDFNAEARDGPLVPFILDTVSCAFYEAKLPTASNLLPTYLESVHVGLDIICLKKDTGGHVTKEEDCETFIRHIKRLRFLPGFHSGVFTYVVHPIPMQPFHCDTHVQFLEKNKVILGFNNNILVPGEPCWKDDYIGWTLFIPGHFSVLLEGENSTHPNCTCSSASAVAAPTTTTTTPDCVCVDGLAIRQSARLESYDFPSFTSALIDFSTPLYKEAQKSVRNLTFVVDPKHRSWDVKLDNCNFELYLIPNSVLHGSGGHVFLDLQDFFTYKVRLVATSVKARVMLQRTLLTLTNSNPLILNVDRNFDRRPSHQELSVVVRPSGVGTGISSVTVRTTACSLKCGTPCSFTIVFQLMRKEGNRLVIDYPETIDPKIVLSPTNLELGVIKDKKGNAIYRRLPVNYRPPSRRGNAIPITKLFYNADPSKPKYANKYAISKQTGEYGKCKGKNTSQQCDCSAEDRLNDHPHLSDCRQMVYVVRRGVETHFRARYPPVMKEKDQNPIYFLNKTHLSVVVEEINGRTEYSIASSADEYLRDINSDKELNLGHRYYDANSMRITCFASGLYHFRTTLGEFDSFDHVAGYFMFLCEESGINSITYTWVLLLTICVAFLLLFFAFLHLRKRLLKHIPLQGETDKIKME